MVFKKEKTKKNECWFMNGQVLLSSRRIHIRGFLNWKYRTVEEAKIKYCKKKGNLIGSQVPNKNTEQEVKFWENKSIGVYEVWEWSLLFGDNEDNGDIVVGNDRWDSWEILHETSKNS